MSPVIVAIIAASISFVASVLTSAFAVGVRFGKLDSDMRTMRDDVKEIKGMFVLRLKD